MTRRDILEALASVVVILVLLLLVRWRKWDADRRANYIGAGDGFTTRALMPDKVVHAVASYGLTLTLALFLPPPVAVFVALLAGVGYEVAQGYVSVYDLVADAIGALLALAAVRLLA